MIKCVRQFPSQIPTKEEFCYDIAVLQDNIGSFDVNISALSHIIINYMERAFGRFEDDILGGDIAYFCFELNFGEYWEPGDVTDVDEYGNVIDIDFSSAEKLYDYLISKINVDEE